MYEEELNEFGLGSYLIRFEFQKVDFGSFDKGELKKDDVLSRGIQFLD